MLLEQKIEAILFYKNEPMEIKKLAQLLVVNGKEVHEALQNLSQNLKNHGLCLIETDEEVSLATAPEVRTLIEQITKEEMSKEIGKAGLETLAIILYNGPMSRREVDYIRGVNSSFILRNLCVRGLLERELDQKDQRIFKYKNSLALLAHLGLKNKEELPEFETFKKSLAEFENTSNQENAE